MKLTFNQLFDDVNGTKEKRSKDLELYQNPNAFDKNADNRLLNEVFQLSRNPNQLK